MKRRSKHETKTVSIQHKKTLTINRESQLLYQGIRNFEA
nr:MAG TPA: hypothetical protein [Caudoviricetes sp.]